ncbi:hypothetical protein [Rathayibacter sp. VKM Ac-2630]|uniref:hypothetical protein n=1 Tax=Rathayibacter sp. VKM Ac-2630 TaxID=1938617 RepID=UPI000980BFF9|nr:hypothetical protein [Rathayibacter sp. VKM Ac-2630]OOB90307.1 hypothetical protein B0T42_12465 [Rathayibacter sp. VKM Ac-2630]
MPTRTSITRTLRRVRPRSRSRVTPLAKAEPAVDLLHSLIGQVVRVRGINPGPSYLAGLVTGPEKPVDITGRINGVRGDGIDRVAVGFVIGGFYTYRIDTIEVIEAPAAADIVVAHTNPYLAL